MKRNIRWGIVGLGNIAAKFASDLKLVDDAVLTAVASRDIEKAKAFAKVHRAEFAYGSYTELFKSGTVDVVYIATPHTSHVNLGIEAMNNGLHVLCEKPMGVNLPEVKQMVATSKTNNAFLMEALWTRFLPSFIKTKELLDKGTIGKLAHINADFAFFGMDRSEEGRVLNPALAGGSLLDIGIYPVFLAYCLLGKPKKIIALANFHTTGIEKQASIIFGYDDAQAILYSGFTSNSETRAEITGSDGRIILTSRWHETEKYCIEKAEKQECFTAPKMGKGYAHEIKEVHSCIANGAIESNLWSHQNSLDLIGLLDSIREKAGITFPFEN